MKTFCTCNTCGKEINYDEATGKGDDYYYRPVTGEQYCTECNFNTPQGFIQQIEGMIETMKEINDIRENLERILTTVKGLELKQSKSSPRSPEVSTVRRDLQITVDMAKSLELDQSKSQRAKPNINQVSEIQDDEAIKRERQHYQHEAGELKSRIRELEKQVIGLDDAPVESGIDMSKVDVRGDDLRKEITRKDREIKALQSGKQELQGELDKIKQVSENTSVQLASLQVRIDHLEKSNYPEQIKKLDAEIRDLKMENDKYDIALKEQRREIGKLEARLKGSQQNP